MKTWFAVHFLALGLAAASTARAEEPTRATAELLNAKGVRVGEATLVGKRNGVLIQIEIDNLQPGTYGLHIHERGSCRGSTFKSAGEHFNPSGARHGFKNPEGPHAGDLWNVDVPNNGRLSVKQYNARVTLKEGTDNSVLREGGTSFILHANRDDYATDPAGDAGAGIACGVIKTMAPQQARSSQPR
jgi:Cu-Zn family superoxide dismutase